MSKEETDIFLSDVRALGLRFPIALVAKITGEERANVAAYIRGGRPAPRSFLNRFYKAFSPALAAEGIHRSNSANQPPTDILPQPLFSDVDWIEFQQNIKDQIACARELIAVSRAINKTVKEKLDRKTV